MRPATLVAGLLCLVAAPLCAAPVIIGTTGLTMPVEDKIGTFGGTVITDGPGTLVAVAPLYAGTSYGPTVLPAEAEPLSIVVLTPDPPTALDEGWDWRLVPFLGAGGTFFQGKTFSLQVGVELGTFPPAFPVVGGRPFGAFLATIGDDIKSGGVGLELGTVADVPVWAGGLLWKDESVEADFVLMVKSQFDVSFSW